VHYFNRQQPLLRLQACLPHQLLGSKCRMSDCCVLQMDLQPEDQQVLKALHPAHLSDPPYIKR
jgi:hypothetical protein